ncbi:hypothetical protein VTN00DRAFT_6809 [Thermoascus crustaceus]|uniref:uncharacterized protein n=1 Tax=Thermoascus crustaceus TaxID=5088 RepID=UPI003743CAD1
MAKPVASAIVRGLTGVPPEVAHQVLDDLTLNAILKLACYDVPYINDCIMSHPACGKFFAHSLQKFFLMRDYFKLYRELYLRIRRWPTYPLDRYLPANLSWAKFDYEEVRVTLHTCIFRVLGMTEDLLDILRQYAPPQQRGLLATVWDSSTLPALQNRRDAIRSAQAELKRIKSPQLERAASLLEENPDILHRATDPEQNQRQNTAHVVSRLRRAAERVARQDILKGTMKGMEYFRNAFFPVVPFNHALGFVVRMLQKYPAPSSLPGSEGESTESLKTDINTIIQGMPYIYLSPIRELEQPAPCSTTTEPHAVRRTWYTPYSVPPYDRDLDSNKPVFGGDRYTPAWYVERYPVAPLKKYQPHDGRELEWLEAFVRVYRYMERLEKGVDM